MADCHVSSKKIAGGWSSNDWFLIIFVYVLPLPNFEKHDSQFDNCNCALFFVSKMGRGNNHQLTNPKCWGEDIDYIFEMTWGRYLFECKVPSGTFCLSWVYRMVPNPRLIMIRSWLDSSGFRKSHHTILLRSHESKIVDFSHSSPADLSQSRHGGRGGVEQRWDDLRLFYLNTGGLLKFQQQNWVSKPRRM